MKNYVFSTITSFIFFLLAFLAFKTEISAQEVQTINTPGSGTFTVPAGVSEITVETWGGGGAYARQTISVSPGNVINYTVGAGSTTTAAGGASQASFNSSVFVRAAGGASVGNNVTAGAVGGPATAGTGSVRFSGGNGASGSGQNGGGGGSSAGTGQAGVNATGITGATAPSGGGNGGNGATSVGQGNGQYNGFGGVNPGGGGGSTVIGGGSLNGTGGSGANGRVRFTYTVSQNPESDLAISVSANNASPQIDDQVTFTFTAENLGDLDDTGVEVEAPVPGGFTFVSSSGGTYNASTGIWNIGNLNASSSSTLSIIATATTVGSSTYIASISGNEVDADTSNNQVSLTLPISCSGDLTSETTSYGGDIQANWNFDGNTDDSVNNFNATAGSPTSYSSDFIEGTASAFFNGSATIQYSNGSFLNDATSIISIAGWIKPTDISQNEVIFDEGGDINGFALWIDENSKLVLSTRNGGPSSQVDVLSVEDVVEDQWQHVAGVFDNGTLSVYLNGAGNSTSAPYSTIQSHGNAGGLGGVLGGQVAIDVAALNYNGFLDGFVYSSNHAFTASQIAEDAIQNCGEAIEDCPPPRAQQTEVSSLIATYRERPVQNALYTNGSQVYSYGVGTDNDLRLDAFVVEDQDVGPINFAFEALADRVVLRRVDNAGTTGNRHILFFEKAAGFSSTAKNFKGVYFPQMEDALLCQCINRGADNVFANSAGTNENNIERIDYIFDEGIVVPDNPNELGFVIMERGGNDNFHLAPIDALDANGDPIAYRDVLRFVPGDWNSTEYNLATAVLSGFTEAPDNENLIETADLSAQNIGAIFVSFANLGYCPGEIVYGYSLAGGDTTQNPDRFVDFRDNQAFPTNTDETSNGGIDLLSGGAVSSKSFIHIPGGWFENEDPSGLDNCNERVVISGGDAQFTQDTNIGFLSVNEGSAQLNSNTLSICKDVETLSPNFRVENGILEMLGDSGQQRITGRGSMIVDQLVLNNADGLDVDVPVRVDGSLNPQNGTVNSKGNLTFYCDFSGNNPKTGMIDDLSNGDVTGDVTTQQCFPGRRAFRFVTPTTTTSGPIRQYWQENASASNDNPNPGYGTHITGLGEENATPTNDGQDGFDWQPSGNPSLFVFDNTARTWSPIDNTDVNTLTAGDPYRIMLRGSRDVNIQFNASPSSNTILRATGPITKGPVTFADPGYGQNLNDVILIGNPFQAIVDLEVTLSKSSNIRPFVQVYDPTLGGIENDGFLGGRGAFTTIDLNNNELDQQSSNPDSDANKYLQAYQAVYFLASGGGQPSIVFEETQKRIQEDQTIIFSEPAAEPKLVVKLYDQASFNAGSTSRDAVTIKFGEYYNNGITEEDAPKLANADENLARFMQGNLLSYEKRNLPSDGEVLPLFTNQYRMSNYVFSINVKDFDDNIKVFLKDNYTDELHELSTETNEVYFNINKSINASTAFNRFSIVFENETLSTEDVDKNALQVYPNPVEDVLHIQLPDALGNSVKVQLFDMFGKRVYNQTHETNNGSLQINQLNLNQGAYILKVSTNNTNLTL